MKRMIRYRLKADRVAENERLAAAVYDDLRRIKPDVQSVEDGARQGYAKMRFEHRRRIRRENGHYVAFTHALAPQGGTEKLTAPSILLPRVVLIAVDDRGARWEYIRSTEQNVEGSERLVVGGPSLQEIRLEINSHVLP